MKLQYVAVVLLSASLLLSACNKQADDASAMSDSSSVSEIAFDLSEGRARENDSGSSIISSDGDDLSSASIVESRTDESDAEAAWFDTAAFGEKTADALNLLSKSQYTVSMTGELAVADGLTTDFQFLFAKDGNKEYNRIVFGGKEFVTLKNSNGTYTLDTENKTAVPVLTNESLNGNHTFTDSDTQKAFSYLLSGLALDQISYSGSGNETFRSTDYEYEEYNAAGGTIKIYFNHTVPEYIVRTDTDGKQSVITVNRFTSDTDSSLFVIPSDYTIIQENS